MQRLRLQVVHTVWLTRQSLRENRKKACSKAKGVPIDEKDPPHREIGEGHVFHRRGAMPPLYCCGYLL